MSKLPFIQWYPADYIAATRHLSHLARSVWSDLLNFMALETPRGVYQRSREAMIHQFNIPVDQFQGLMEELSTVAIVQWSTDYVTLTSRRMLEDEKKRIMTLNRKRKERGLQPVTLPSHESHREKLEVRSQKLGTSKTKDVPPVVPQELIPADVTQADSKPYAIPLPEEKPADSLVLFYKVLQGAPYDFRPWDKGWGHWKKRANELLEIFQGNYSAAYQCLKQKAEELTEAKRTWTFETILKQAHLWRQQHGGEAYVLVNRERFLREVIDQRRKRKIEGLRERSTPGEVLHESGDIQTLPSGDTKGQNGEVPGRDNGNGRSLAPLSPGNLESAEDREVQVQAAESAGSNFRGDDHWGGGGNGDG